MATSRKLEIRHNVLEMVPVGWFLVIFFYVFIITSIKKQNITFRLLFYLILKTSGACTLHKLHIHITIYHITYCYIVISVFIFILCSFALFAHMIFHQDGCPFLLVLTLQGTGGVHLLTHLRLSEVWKYEDKNIID